MTSSCICIRPGWLTLIFSRSKSQQTKHKERALRERRYFLMCARWQRAALSYINNTNAYISFFHAEHISIYYYLFLCTRRVACQRAFACVHVSLFLKQREQTMRCNKAEKRRLLCVHYGLSVVGTSRVPFSQLEWIFADSLTSCCGINTTSRSLSTPRSITRWAFCCWFI